MPVVIRRATFADLPAILALIEEAYSPYIARIGKKPGPMLEDYAAMIASGTIDVALDDAGMAGLVVLLVEGGKALLDNLAVGVRARGTGIGGMLIAHAEKKARNAGFDRISLYTHEKMTENRALYPHLGYRETHRVSEKGFDRVYFEKSLLPF